MENWDVKSAGRKNAWKLLVADFFFFFFPGFETARPRGIRLVSTGRIGLPFSLSLLLGRSMSFCSFSLGKAVGRGPSLVFQFTELRAQFVAQLVFHRNWSSTHFWSDVDFGQPFADKFLLCWANHRRRPSSAPLAGTNCRHSPRTHYQRVHDDFRPRLGARSPSFWGWPASKFLPACQCPDHVPIEWPQARVKSNFFFLQPACNFQFARNNYCAKHSRSAIIDYSGEFGQRSASTKRFFPHAIIRPGFCRERLANTELGAALRAIQLLASQRPTGLRGLLVHHFRASCFS